MTCHVQLQKDSLVVIWNVYPMPLTFRHVSSHFKNIFLQHKWPVQKLIAWTCSCNPLNLQMCTSLVCMCHFPRNSRWVMQNIVQNRKRYSYTIRKSIWQRVIFHFVVHVRCAVVFNCLQVFWCRHNGKFSRPTCYIQYYNSILILSFIIVHHLGHNWIIQFLIFIN